MSPSWQFWVDRGGTFTDVIGVDEQGHCVIEKLLSEAPEQYNDAVIEGIQRILSAQQSNLSILRNDATFPAPYSIKQVD